MKKIILEPLISEKNSYHNSAGIYVFNVAKQATKNEIKTAVEAGFGVKVETVRTMLSRGKRKNSKFGPTKLTYHKKALVQLKPGQKIALFEGA